MLSSIFQNSKSALIFAASVIVCALMLIGPKESGGVLDKAVNTYKDERANFANNAAMMSEQMSAPVIGDYKSQVSGLEESANGADMPMASASTSTRVIRLDPETGAQLGEVAPPPLSTGFEQGADAALGGPQASGANTAEAAPVRGEPVVTSRMIRIEPQ
jgi:hypothetical protein